MLVLISQKSGVFEEIDFENFPKNRRHFVLSKLIKSENKSSIY